MPGMADPPPYPGAPRWLRMFAFAVGTLALLLIVLGHVGSAFHHGPPTSGEDSHGTAPGDKH
jgi:hypothetical protein